MQERDRDQNAGIPIALLQMRVASHFLSLVQMWTKVQWKIWRSAARGMSESVAHVAYRRPGEAR